VNRGILSGLGAYLIWGFIPVYFKLLQAVPAVEIMFHRVIWSLVLLMALITLRQQWTPLRHALRQPRLLGIYSLSALLLAANWWIYIYGVNAGQVVETSLGYFINPLLSVALGVIFLGERPRPLQWLPVGLATLGVLYLTIQYGRLPWIALSLAFSFGFYGLIKKVAPLGSLNGLTLETLLLSLPALGYLLAIEFTGQGVFLHTTWQNNVLLVLVGVVTAVPLLLYGVAARSIPLWMLGLLQYLAPTCQFLVGVLLYKEPFSPAQMVGFGIIWVALLIFSGESLLNWKRAHARSTVVPISAD
jgi:chloramphenicol-sensitive protein RarD